MWVWLLTCELPPPDWQGLSYSRVETIAMVNRVVWKRVVKRKQFINAACFLRGSGSNYYSIIILLISPEKPTKTGRMTASLSQEMSRISSWWQQCSMILVTQIIRMSNVNAVRIIIGVALRWSEHPDPGPVIINQSLALGIPDNWDPAVNWILALQWHPEEADMGVTVSPDSLLIFYDDGC